MGKSKVERAREAVERERFGNGGHGLRLRQKPPRAQPESRVSRRAFSRQECDTLLKMFEELSIERSDPSLDRKSESVSLDRRRLDWVYERVANMARLENVWSLVLTGFVDEILIQRYRVGGYSGCHNDIDFLTQDYPKLTIVVPLVERRSWRGGDLLVGTSLRPVGLSLGSAVIFPSYLMHEVTRVTAGRRVVLTAWVGGPPLV